MPRRVAAPTSTRLSPPDPPLADDRIRLEPMAEAHTPELVVLLDDEAIARYTLIPSDASEGFIRTWAAGYERAWRDGGRAGFVIRGADGTFLGFASFISVDLDAREGEIGYALPAAARGRGVAARALRLLTRWGFDSLALERIELQIDVSNSASERVAERVGYRREGVRRSVHFKEGVRVDLGFWSLLRSDPAVS